MSISALHMSLLVRLSDHIAFLYVFRLFPLFPMRKEEALHFSERHWCSYCRSYWSIGMRRFSAFCRHVLREKRLYGLYILPEKANTIVPSIIYTACPSGSQESWSQEAECTMSQSFTKQTQTSSHSHKMNKLSSRQHGRFFLNSHTALFDFVQIGKCSHESC